MRRDHSAAPRAGRVSTRSEGQVVTRPNEVKVGLDFPGLW